MQKLAEQGHWSSGISWRLYESDVLPELSLITAVLCVAIHDEKIILMRAKRGWGMIGGHIESGETVIEALTRESQEEGGFTPESPQLFGYREITAKVPINHPSNDTMYPYPTSYIAYYWATTTKKITQPTGNEVLESKAFSLDEIRLAKLPDTSTIELGWNAYVHRSF